MTKPDSEKKWSDFAPNEITHYYPLIADRARNLGDGAHGARNELAKYLFAANTGAAAGLFFLLKTWPDGQAFLTAFYLFCAGTFFVGLSYLLCADWGHEIADGWARDSDRLLRNEITLGELDAGHRNRSSSLKFKMVRGLLWVSFFLLMAGGITAAIPFWPHSTAKQATNLIKKLAHNE